MPERKTAAKKVSRAPFAEDENVNYVADLNTIRRRRSTARPTPQSAPSKPAEELPTEPLEQPVPSPALTARKPRVETRKQPERESSTSSSYAPQMTVEIESEIKLKLFDLAKRWKVPTRSVLMYSLNHDLDETRELVQRWQRKQADFQSSQLDGFTPSFLVREESKTRKRRDPATLAMRLTRANQDALIERAAQVGAEGRGELIEACLDVLPESPPQGL